MTIDEINKLMQTIALVNVGVQQLSTFLANKQAQAGKTETEILDHAEASALHAREVFKKIGLNPEQ